MATSRTDLGNLLLSSGESMSMSFRRVSHFGAVWRTTCTRSQVEFDMPSTVESHARNHVDRVQSRVDLRSLRTVPWFDEGKARKELLTWAEQCKPVGRPNGAIGHPPPQAPERERP